MDHLVKLGIQNSPEGVPKTPGYSSSLCHACVHVVDSKGYQALYLIGINLLTVLNVSNIMLAVPLSFG